MWTEETISDYCQSLVDEYFNGEGIFMLDVIISKRMRRMHGCVEFYNGVPIEMKISGYVLDNATDEEIKCLLKHEFAHWYAWFIDGECHGHDKLFKSICDRIGCDSKEPTWKMASLENMTTKWEVVCSDCGCVYRYHRANNKTKFPERYYCRECGGSLYAKQNW